MLNTQLSYQLKAKNSNASTKKQKVTNFSRWQPQKALFAFEYRIKKIYKILMVSTMLPSIKLIIKK